eukprot:6214822-Pleurochrysis_carterae.AAC.3
MTQGNTFREGCDSSNLLGSVRLKLSAAVLDNLGRTLPVPSTWRRVLEQSAMHACFVLRSMLHTSTVRARWRLVPVRCARTCATRAKAMQAFRAR